MLEPMIRDEMYHLGSEAHLIPSHFIWQIFTTCARRATVMPELSRDSPTALDSKRPGRNVRIDVYMKLDGPLVPSRL